MRSFCVEKAQLALQSTWDPATMTATPLFVGKTDTYLLKNSWYDPFLKKHMIHKGMIHKGMIHKGRQKLSYVNMTDTVRKGLLESLSYDPEAKGGDIGSHVIEVSNLTGDEDTVTASTVNTNATPHHILRTKEYAKQLAESREQKALHAQEINKLKQQMQQMQ
jgi:hypothetical protein